MSGKRETRYDVLVTGAGGFLGGAIQRGLIYEGFSAIGSYHHAPRKEGLAADLLRPSGVRVFEDLHAELIIHCAAVIPEAFSGKGAQEAAEKNLLIDRNIIEFCAGRNMHLLFCSSSSVYGLHFDGIRTEDARPDPVGPYAEAKLMSERLAIERLGADRVSIFRINAPYGLGQKNRTVLQIFMERAQRNEDLLYYGTGSRTQDFTWVGDVARAVVCSVRRKKAGVFNISGGYPVSMAELGDIVVKAIPGCASTVRAAHVPDPQENFRALFDISKAKRELGWEPKMPLGEGIRQCVLSVKEGR